MWRCLSLHQILILYFLAEAIELRREVFKKIKIIAIALMITGILSFIVGIVIVVFGVTGDVKGKYPVTSGFSMTSGVQVIRYCILVISLWWFIISLYMITCNVVMVTTMSLWWHVMPFMVTCLVVIYIYIYLKMWNVVNFH